MIQITLNKELHSIAQGSTLESFLALQGFSQGHFAVAINQQIIRRELYTTTLLNDGDSILLIGAVKGG